MCPGNCCTTVLACSPNTAGNDALVWFRTGQDLSLLGCGFGISRATAYRYRDEAVAVLAATCRDSPDAWHRAAEDGWT